MIIIMKRVFVLFMTSLMGTVGICQEIDYNTKNGYMAEGYDVVAYFDGKAEKGDKIFSTAFDDVKFKFINKVNLDRFKSNPEAFIPQYGGWCAYAMAVQNKKVSVNPETYEVRDNKLYLFYNGIMGNSLENWLNEGPDELIPKADSNWNVFKEMN